ncbi:MAG: glycosyltransferase family 2 protein [Candidatus Omnitrophica bacterium]|nr:glycosyltransferase family 2 protein [Candidatus Omnitrophota bacterium]
MRLSIIIPAYNEEDNIREVIEKIEFSLGIPHELVVVNDHSVDRTAEIISGLCAKYKNIKLVHNNRQRGFANALRTGFESASTELLVPVMGDLCDDLSTIRKMLSKADEGYDIICGCRYIKGGSRLGGSKVKGFFSSFVGWTLHYLLWIPTHDVANAFKMYRKKVIDGIDIQAKGFEISMEIALKGYYAGFRITEVPTVWRERTKGKSSFKMLRLFPDYFKLYLWGILKALSR